MPKHSDLEKIYTNAQSALKAREFDRATNLLTQILVIDENYKDASRLLARLVKEKRRRWHNDPRIWGTLIGLIVVGLLIWFVPKLPLKAIFTPASEVGSPAPTAISTQAATLTIPPTAIPLAWKRISIGLEFARDTVTGIVVDKNDLDVIYVGMKNAGVYKSIDGGLSWSPRSQGVANTNLESLTIDPQNPKILYAGTLGGIFKTRDGGENWERIGEGRRLLMDPHNSSHLYAQGNKDKGGGLYESTDQGDTWERHGSPCPDLWSWAIDPQDGMTLFGSDMFFNSSCPIGLYKSSDGGRTWNFLGLSDQTIDSLAVGEDEQENVLIYVNANHQDLISNDGGKNWIPQTPGCRYLPVQPDLPDTVYCSGFQSNMFIYTAGKSPQEISFSSSSIIFVTAFHSDNYQGTQRLIAGGQGLYISTDNGKSWSNRSSGLGATRLELKIDPADNERMYLATYLTADEQECVLFRSDDSGKIWKQIMKGGGVSWCGPAFGATNALYILKEKILERSMDSGDTWTSLSLPSGMNFGSVSANPYLAGFLYAESNEPFYSTDDGISWQKATIDNMNYFNSRLYFAKGGYLIYSVQLSFSTDGGKSWHNCNDPSVGEWTKSDSQLVIDPGNPKHLTLATNGNGIFISDDGCQSWQSSSIGLGNLFVNSVALDPNNPNMIYAGTNGGAYVSYDRGQSWGQINDGLLRATVVYSIVVDPQSNVYAATPYGVFQLEKK